MDEIGEGPGEHRCILTHHGILARKSHSSATTNWCLAQTNQWGLSLSLSLSLLLLFPLFVHPLNTEFPGSPLGILGLSPPEAGANAVTRGPRTAARSWHTSVMGIKSWAKTANGGEQLPHGEKATGSGGGSDNRFSLIGKDPILYTFKERNINKIPMIIQHINGLQFKRSFRSTEVICLE